MDENFGAIPDENSNIPETEGITFSGGSDNAFIKEFASATLPDSTTDKLFSQSELDSSFDLDSIFAEPDKPEEQSSPEPVKKLSAKDLVNPVSDDEDAPVKTDETVAEEKKPLSRFARIFSENTGFSVFSLITGIVLLVWNILFVVTAVTRDRLFASTELSMAAQGQLYYTAEFSSPVLTVLKVLTYLLPVLVLAWVIVFRKSDGKNHIYNKKTVIVIMCLIALASLMVVFDIAAAHLVMA